MANHDHRNRAPVPMDGRAPATLGGTLDANGFDPAEFEWRPVPRRARRDGWTPEVQQRFIEELARTGVVERACEAVGMSVGSAYALRTAPGGEGFARAWREVLIHAAERVLDIAFEHAIEGEEVPVFDCDGIRTGAKRRYNTRMAMFILRAYFPERFRHAHQDVRRADEPPPPPPVPLPVVVTSLAPVTPPAPQLMATPERLDDMIENARILQDYDESFQPSDRQPYKHRRVADTHPAVSRRATRKRTLRQQREDRQDYMLGLDADVPVPPPGDPHSGYSCRVQAEKERARLEAAAAEEDEDALLDDGDLFGDEEEGDAKDGEEEDGDAPAGDASAST
ncbi:hypothetical protein [Sphingomonas sp.]|uniref:hypothetical protein n=1 Tax=Sphingomonas sp. TaxID=28214 RepID=UPI003CC5A27B